MIIKETLNEKCFELYANCILEKGITRAIIIDLQKSIFFFIPLSLYTFLKEAKNKPIDSILIKYSLTERKILKEYTNFIISNNLGHFTNLNTKDHLPPLPNLFEAPSLITNAIYDYSELNKQYLNKFLADLLDLGCNNVQIRVFNDIDSATAEHLEEAIMASPNTIFELLVICNPQYHLSYWENVLYRNANILIISVYNVIERAIPIIDKANRKYLIVSNNTNINKHNCGQISTNYFAINISHYTESKMYNTCLNKKLGVDENGYLCNCPSMNEKYGHISHIPLNSLISKEEFKKVWSITKSQIQICRICEFKSVCTDCRAYLQDPDDLNSKPLKCGYNPYTGVWSEWTTNPISKKAVDFYKLNQFEK
jgi:SPASM domain peptide maturase of grasp-with-spasm system